MSQQSDSQTTGQHDLVVTVESSEDGVARIVLAGELDLANAHEVHERLPEATAAAGHVVVDLSGLTFIDSTGIRLLLQLQKAAARDGWQLRLVPGPSQVQKVLRLVGLEDRLPFVEGGQGPSS